MVQLINGIPLKKLLLILRYFVMLGHGICRKCDGCINFNIWGIVEHYSKRIWTTAYIRNSNEWRKFKISSDTLNCYWKYQPSNSVCFERKGIIIIVYSILSMNIWWDQLLCTLAMVYVHGFAYTLSCSFVIQCYEGSI